MNPGFALLFLLLPPFLFSKLFISVFFQVVYLVTEKFFFQNKYMDFTKGSKMTLVNIDPHVILHQKTHVPRAVNFFESQKASQHPVLAYQS